MKTISSVFIAVLFFAALSGCMVYAGGPPPAGHGCFGRMSGCGKCGGCADKCECPHCKGRKGSDCGGERCGPPGPKAACGWEGKEGKGR